LVTHRIHQHQQGAWLCFVVCEAWFHLQNLPKITMYSEDYQEWRWGQILTGRKDYNPDDQPTQEEDEEDAQTQE
jgi:hypothetical protein